jgi:hypothetical protein
MANVARIGLLLLFAVTAHAQCDTLCVYGESDLTVDKSSGYYSVAVISEFLDPYNECGEEGCYIYLSVEGLFQGEDETDEVSGSYSGAYTEVDFDGFVNLDTLYHVDGSHFLSILGYEEDLNVETYNSYLVPAMPTSATSNGPASAGSPTDDYVTLHVAISPGDVLDYASANLGSQNAGSTTIDYPNFTFEEGRLDFGTSTLEVIGSMYGYNAILATDAGEVTRSASVSDRYTYFQVVDGDGVQYITIQTFELSNTYSYSMGSRVKSRLPRAGSPQLLLIQRATLLWRTLSARIQ